MSTVTPNKGLTEPAYNDPGWDVTLNADFTIIDTALGGVLTLNASSGDASLTSAQYQNLIVIVQNGTGNVTYTIPAGVGGQWIVSNTMASSYTVTFVSGGGGTSVTIANGANASIFSDGTNISPVQQQVSTIPSGTVMVFFQASAPTGWTQRTDLNDYTLRVVNGTPGYVGGTVNPGTGFSSWLFQGTDLHTLTTNEIPSHNHGVFDPGHAHKVVSQTGGGGGNGGHDTLCAGINFNAFGELDTYVAVTNISVGYTGGNQGHNHPFLSLAILDFILATKN